MYLEFLAVNAALPDMPLFLSEERYINVPLEATYDLAFRGLPAFLKCNVLNPAERREESKNRFDGQAAYG